MSVQETPIAAARKRLSLTTPSTLKVLANSQAQTAVALGGPPKGKMWLVEHVSAFGIGGLNTATDSLSGTPQWASLDISEDGGRTWIALVYEEHFKNGVSLAIVNKVAVAEDEQLRLNLVLRNDTATVSLPTVTVTAQVLELDPVMDGPKGTSIPANALLVIDD